MFLIIHVVSIPDSNLKKEFTEFKKNSYQQRELNDVQAYTGGDTDVFYVFLVSCKTPYKQLLYPSSETTVKLSTFKVLSES